MVVVVVAAAVVVAAVAVVILGVVCGVLFVEFWRSPCLSHYCYTLCIPHQQALQEFAVLTQQLHPSATIATLSLWSIMYNKLSTVSGAHIEW